LDRRSENRNREGIRPDAVLLDAAGTLIRPSEPVGDTYAAVARSFGAEIDPGRLMQAFAEVFGEMPAMAFAWESKDELRRLERDWWRTLVCRVIERVGNGIGDFDGFFQTLYEHYAQGEAWACFPEVPRVLDALRGRGCRLAVVSNFDSRLPAILRSLGIHRQMDAVVYSTAAGRAKPAPGIFLQALDAIGVAPQRALHVGDNYEADVEGADMAGVTGLLIRRDTGIAVDSARAIRRLDELLTRFV